MTPPQPGRSGVNNGGISAGCGMGIPGEPRYSVALKESRNIRAIRSRLTGTSMILTKKQIGPRHHGRKMSLKAFEFAKVKDGYIAELARGYLVVSEVANVSHGLQISFIRNHLGVYF